MIDSDQLDPTPDRISEIRLNALAEEAKPKKSKKDKTQEQPFASLVQLPHVHYVLPNGDNRGACRPLIITDIVSLEDGIVDGCVLTNREKDYYNIAGQEGFLPGYSVHYAPLAEQEVDTWHWSHEH